MQLTVVDFAKDRVIFSASDCTREQLETKQDLFFISEGYKLKSSDAETRTYTKGNRTLRILFGAFVKYHKQTVVVKQDGMSFQVMLQRDSTGISGGLIGMNQVKKEFERLTDAFKVYFTN